MTLRWSRRAVRHLISLEAYIAKDKPEAAARTVSRIVDSTQRLAELPSLGRSGRTADSRELIIPGLPYIVIYRVLGDVIDIGSVIHTSRKWPDRV